MPIERMRAQRFVNAKPLGWAGVVAGSLCAVMLTAAPAGAQWTSDSNANTAISTLPGGEQVQPKIRVRADGSAWVTFYNNAAGGYKPTIQRLDPQGNKLLGAGLAGVRLANTTNTSTVDYDLTVDPAGNAIVAFMDNSSGTSQVTVQKVLPDGTLAWNAGAGVQMPQSSGAANPKVAIISSGRIVVGWSVSPGFRMQGIDDSGAAPSLIGTPVTVSESGRTVTLSDLKASSDGGVIALWIRPFNTSFLSSKYLYAMKYSDSFAELWPRTPIPGSNPPATAAGLIIYGPVGAPYGTQGGSVQNGYFPTFIADGAGGAIFGWYENAGPRNCYVQRVLSNGTLVFTSGGQTANGATNGLGLSTRATTTTAPNITLGLSLAYDAAGDTILAAWNEADRTTQNVNGLFAQAIGGQTRVPSFAAGGVALVASQPGQFSFVRNTSLGGGAMAVVAFDAQTVTTGFVRAWALDATGSPLAGWTNPVGVSTTGSGKSRLDLAASPTGDTFAVFGDNRSGTTNVFGQRVNRNGSLGNPAGCVADFNSDGVVNTDDISDYITAYFTEPAVPGPGGYAAPCPGAPAPYDLRGYTADFNRDCIVNTDDISDYITAYFNPQPGC